MRSKTMAADVAALIRARNPLIWVVTREEARVERYLMEAAAAAGYVPWTWDVAQGCADMTGKRQPAFGGTDPGDMLGAIAARAENARERGVWIMRDLAPWLEGPIGMTTTRALRNLARTLPGVARDNAQAIIVLTPRAVVPEELAGHATVIEWPLPDREEIADVLDAAVEALPEEMQIGANGAREAAIDAAVGLTGEEAAACYARSLVQLRRIDPTLVASEKRRVVARERVLEWLDALPGGLDQVGGLDLLKGWLGTRALAYSPAARAYGLPAPKGALLVGISGNGKTLSARAIATAWGVPLLKLDLGALKSRWVGDSEANLRKAFGVIGAIGRCVVLIDEIEKSLAGATQGAADGGVSADALGAILSWMSDRESQAFIVATANDVSALPPEILRKGRFDEIFWVDLPTPTERAEILLAALRAHGRDGSIFYNSEDIARLVDATEGFTGAEIASLVPDALFTAFADGGREIDRDDLLAAAATVVPLSKTAAEKIEKLRQWAQGRARPATSPEVVGTAPARGRTLDL
jgi:ATPase family associated with various cellular activities (AAA)/AAA+ lid domain